MLGARLHRDKARLAQRAQVPGGSGLAEAQVRRELAGAAVAESQFGENRAAVPVDEDIEGGLQVQDVHAFSMYSAYISLKRIYETLPG
ncbi:hypothetical protein RGU41_03005 [Cryobacterium sp. 10C3]|nr:hypothetical protein [Cryobacterium sp. 10C3]MDY7555821.1 hypothetical protein [Cryobacterium sp. 10C3]